jgi:hypothetical protein
MLWSLAPEAETWSESILVVPEIAPNPRPSPNGQLLAFQAVERGLTQVAVMTPESVLVDPHAQPRTWVCG